MKKVKIYSKTKKIPGELLTPVAVFLKIKERYQFPILLESTDYAIIQNSNSLIGFDPLASIKILLNEKEIFINKDTNKEKSSNKIEDDILNFMHLFEVENKTAVKLIGYISYEAVNKIENINTIKENKAIDPIAFYLIYKNTIVFNHYNNEIELIGNGFTEQEAENSLQEIENILRLPLPAASYFLKDSEEFSTTTENDFKQNVENAISHCKRGDVFQLVLSRGFEQKFKGDDFFVYRNLRRINPSPYLYYFDLGEFRIIGSSPEAQLIIKENIAEVHPIAGTYKRTQNDQEDLKAIAQLKLDPKENAEHMMLVDLARNDLSINCDAVTIKSLKEIVIYSHVIHLVSKVTGKLKKGVNAFSVLCNTFPAGTLSGAPKYKAMELIKKYENTNRNYYGGSIGIIGFDNSINQAIIIRSIKSKNNVLYFKAGAGIVVNSNPEMELQEVYNKTNVLRSAISITHDNFKNE